MKKLIAMLLGLNTCGLAFAQKAPPNSPGLILDIGVNQVVINNPALDLWAVSHYRKNANPGVSGHFDLAIAGKWDADLHVSAANPFLVAGIEFGKRLTRPNKWFTSYINLDYGEFDAIFNDMAPLHYTPTPDQQGQDLQLRSNNTYFGITSRNYFNRLHFFVGKGHKAIFASGFYIKGGWMPFRQQWRYGYNEEDGTDSDGNTTYDFKSVKVYGIPNINKYFVDAGFFVGLSIK